MSKIINEMFDLQFKTVGELKDYFFKRETAFLGSGIIESVNQFLSDPSMNIELEHLKQQGERLEKGIMIYDDDWDMERCSTPYRLSNLIEWENTPNGDPEWIWMLNRQGYLLQLAKLYTLTKETKYLYLLFNFFEQWIDYHEKNLVTYISTSCRTIDTGIRLKNWSWVLNIVFQHKEVQELLSDELFSKILCSMYQQTEYLMDQRNLSISPISNWKVLEMNGSITSVLFIPEWKKSSTWLKESMDYVQTAASIQFPKDGYHWEQSHMYHFEVLISLLEIFELGNRQDYTFNKNFKDTLNNAIRASLSFRRPDGTQSAYGDSDVEQLETVLTFASLVLKNSEAKYFGEKRLSFNTYSWYGSQADSIYSSIEAREPDQKDFLLPDSGLVFMRETWGKDSSFTMFKCGPQGGGHGHSDLMHFEIQVGEDTLLSDSGRYTYLEGSEERKYFKNAKSHNTCLMDNNEFTNQKGSWGFQKVAHTLPVFSRFLEKVKYIEASHLGYFSNEENVLTQRKLFNISTGIWLVIDVFHTQKKHSFQQYYNFPTKKLNKLSDNRFVYQGKCNKLFINSINEQGVAKIEDAWHSTHYNKKHESKRLIIDSQSPKIVTVLSLNREVSIRKKEVLDLYGQTISECFVNAYEIVDGSDIHTIIVNHFEDQTTSGRKSYEVDGKYAYGRAIYMLDSVGKHTEIEVLKG